MLEARSSVNKQVDSNRLGFDLGSGITYGLRSLRYLPVTSLLSSVSAWGFVLSHSHSIAQNAFTLHLHPSRTLLDLPGLIGGSSHP